MCIYSAHIRIRTCQFRALSYNPDFMDYFWGGGGGGGVIYSYTLMHVANAVTIIMI